MLRTYAETHLLSAASARPAASDKEGGDSGDEEGSDSEAAPDDVVAWEAGLRATLGGARQTLKAAVPYGAVAEKLHRPPATSALFDPSVPSYDVDTFLFPDDEDVDALCDSGLVSRTFCAKCGSTETKPTQLISHSFSEEQLCFLASALLYPCAVAAAKAPVADGRPFRVVDVGSRLGVVLLAAHETALLARDVLGEEGARRTVTVTGVELNGPFCDVARKMLQRSVAAADRRHGNVPLVVTADILGDVGRQWLRDADFVVMNNVFEWFLPPAEQADAWAVVKKETLLSSGRSTTKDPKFLMAYPSLEETLGGVFAATDGKGTATDAAVAKFLSGWVERVPVDVDRWLAARRPPGGHSHDDGHSCSSSCGGGDSADSERAHTTELLQSMCLYRVVGHVPKV